MNPRVSNLESVLDFVCLAKDLKTFDTYGTHTTPQQNPNNTTENGQRN